MAVHDLDMTRFLAGTDPIEILAVGSCHIDKSIENLPGSEAFDTASCIVRYPGGVNAMVDVCRQSSYGYDQRAEVLGTAGMIATDNVYPNTAKIYRKGKLICSFHSIKLYSYLILLLSYQSNGWLQTLLEMPTCRSTFSFHDTLRLMLLRPRLSVNHSLRTLPFHAQVLMALWPL